MGIEEGRLPSAYRWSKRALIVGAIVFSAAILGLGMLALVLLGIPIALITGLVAGEWQVAKQTMAQIWRLGPLLLAAEFALAWLLLALFLIVRRVLAKMGVAVA